MSPCTVVLYFLLCVQLSVGGPAASATGLEKAPVLVCLLVQSVVVKAAVLFIRVVSYPPEDPRFAPGVVKMKLQRLSPPHTESADIFVVSHGKFLSVGKCLTLFLFPKFYFVSFPSSSSAGLCIS